MQHTYSINEVIIDMQDCTQIKKIEYKYPDATILVTRNFSNDCTIHSIIQKYIYDKLGKDLDIESLINICYTNNGNTAVHI